MKTKMEIAQIPIVVVSAAILILIGTSIILSYAAARIVSMLFDGVPVSDLVLAIAFEVIIGLAYLAVTDVSKATAAEVA